MSVSAAFYSRFIDSIFRKKADMFSDNLFVMLLDSSYTPNQDTHQYVSDLTGEITGAGYTSGGVQLTTVSITYDSVGKLWTFTADDASWAVSTLTARYAIVYDRTPATNATRPLILFQDFGTDVSSSGDTFLIHWNATGIGDVLVGTP